MENSVHIENTAVPHFLNLVLAHASPAIGVARRMALISWLRDGSSLFSTLRNDVTCHFPPRGAGTPSSISSLTRAVGFLGPNLSNMGRRFSANFWAAILLEFAGSISKTPPKNHFSVWADEASHGWLGMLPHFHATACKNRLKCMVESRHYASSPHLWVSSHASKASRSIRTLRPILMID